MPNTPDSRIPENNPEALASGLEPVLREACGGRLGPIEWFRSPWQRGGAATGFGLWTKDDGSTAGTMVKLPVGAREHFWTGALSDAGCTHTPRVVAGGTTLGNYDLAWLVLERLRGKTVGKDLERECVISLLTANCAFHRLAALQKPVSPADAQPAPDWEGLLERARAAVRDNHIEHEQRWNEALKRTQRRLGELVAHWASRPINTWCHGDLHPGNALYRGPKEREGDLVLIDLALVHAGHWIEDAVYLERLYWGHEGLLHGVKPVSMLARLRREQGMETGDDYAQFTNTRRILMAACVPAFLGREGRPVYVEAALGILDRLGRDPLP